MAIHNLSVDLSRPLLKGGPKFLSQTIVVKDNVAHLKPTISAMLFCIVYIVVGGFLLGLASYLLIVSNKYDLVIFLGGLGIAIATFGVSLIRPFLRQVNFNKDLGTFDNRRDRDVKLHHIVSLQLTNKIVQSKHALNYYCYELNLLTKNGRRINILNHNDQEQILKDAQLLGEFLDIEVKDLRREIVL